MENFVQRFKIRAQNHKMLVNIVETSHSTFFGFSILYTLLVFALCSFKSRSWLLSTLNATHFAGVSLKYASYLNEITTLIIYLILDCMLSPNMLSFNARTKSRTVTKEKLDRK